MLLNLCEHLICFSGSYDRWYKIWNLNSPLMPVTVLKRGNETSFSITLLSCKEKFMFCNNPRPQNSSEVLSYFFSPYVVCAVMYCDPWMEWFNPFLLSSFLIAPALIGFKNNKNDRKQRPRNLIDLHLWQVRMRNPRPIVNFRTFRGNFVLQSCSLGVETRKHSLWKQDASAISRSVFCFSGAKFASVKCLSLKWENVKGSSGIFFSIRAGLYANFASVLCAMTCMCNYLQEYRMNFTGLLGLVL